MRVESDSAMLIVSAMPLLAENLADSERDRLSTVLSTSMNCKLSEIEMESLKFLVRPLLTDSDTDNVSLRVLPSIALTVSVMTIAS